ncbi:one cut domain family member 3-like [Falco rusticolus]|uniref:one cut domain family member 3-like n=1 Tax=Falco rusticolus TaxID=120794 RepID=UPI0018865524|nr:one cut domain family member 3-like [Falco rusticolus]
MKESGITPRDAGLSGRDPPGNHCPPPPPPPPPCACCGRPGRGAEPRAAPAEPPRVALGRPRSRTNNVRLGGTKAAGLGLLNTSEARRAAQFIGLGQPPGSGSGAASPPALTALPTGKQPPRVGTTAQQPDVHPAAAPGMLLPPEVCERNILHSAGALPGWDQTNEIKREERGFTLHDALLAFWLANRRSLVLGKVLREFPIGSLEHEPRSGG